jgi:hypothetical protein
METCALITGIAALFLATGTAHAGHQYPPGLTIDKCNITIEKPDYAEDVLRVSAACPDSNGVLVTEEKYLKIEPKNEPACTTTLIDEVEKIDNVGFLVYTRCGTKKRALSLQFIGNTLMITNTENY